MPVDVPDGLEVHPAEAQDDDADDGENYENRQDLVDPTVSSLQLGVVFGFVRLQCSDLHGQWFGWTKLTDRR